MYLKVNDRLTSFMFVEKKFEPDSWALTQCVSHSVSASVTSAIVVVAALGEMICPVIVGNVRF
jgi:hypothetical protein